MMSASTESNNMPTSINSLVLAAKVENTSCRLLSPDPSVASQISNRWFGLITRRSPAAPTPGGVASSAATLTSPPPMTTAPSIATSLAPSTASELQDLKEEANLNKQLVHDLQVDLQAFQNKEETLKNMIMINDKQIVDLEVDKAGLEGDVRTHVEEKEKLKERVDELRSNILLLEGEVASKVRKIEQLEAMKGFATVQGMNADQLASEIETLKEQVTQLSALVALKGEQLDVSKATYGTEVESLRAQLSDAQAIADSKSQQLADTEARFRTLLDTKENSDDELKFEQATNYDLQEQLVLLQEDLQFKIDCNATMNRKLREKEAEVEQLEIQLVAIKTKTSASEDVGKGADLQAQLDASSTEMAELRATFEGQDAELARLRSTIQGLELSLKEATSNVEQAEDTIKNVKLDNKKLSHENDALAQIVATSERDLKDYATAVNRIQRTIARLQEERDTTRAATEFRDQAILDKHNDECDQYKAKLQDKSEEIKVLESNLLSLQKAALTNDSAQEDETSRMKEDLRRLRLDLDGEVAKRTAELEWGMERLKEQQTPQVPSSSQAELEQAKNDLASRDAQVAELTAKVQWLERDQRGEQIAHAVETRKQTDRIAALEKQNGELKSHFLDFSPGRGWNGPC